MTGYKGPFKVMKWKWYLVDLRNWYTPVIVRKHFDTQEQAKAFKEKYVSKEYDLISGLKALEFGLRDWQYSRVNKPQYRHSIARLPKYDYPPHIKTQYQRQIWRMLERNKVYRKQRRIMKVTYKVVKEILDNKEVLFFKRLKEFRDYYQAYSQKVPIFKELRKQYTYPKDIVRLSAIYLCLKKYYDMGLHNQAHVVILIYELFPEKVAKWLDKPKSYYKNEDAVKAEFLARGFIKFTNSDFVRGKDAFVESIHIRPTLVYPEYAWHNIDQINAGIGEYRVYELQALVGIPGYTRASITDSNL